jgi:hypothetical protein
MSARRTNLTIPEGLYDLAQQTMASKHYESFSEYVAELIRRDALESVSTFTEKGKGYRAKGISGKGNIEPRNAAAPLPTYLVMRKAHILEPLTKVDPA